MLDRGRVLRNTSFGCIGRLDEKDTLKQQMKKQKQTIIRRIRSVFCFFRYSHQGIQKTGSDAEIDKQRQNIIQCCN